MTDLIVSLIIGLVFVTALFFFLIKPQTDRLKAHRKLIADLKLGDNVITAGGVVGKVVEVKNERYISLEIAYRVVVTVRRDMVYGYADEDWL